MIDKALKTFDPSLFHPTTVIGEFSGRDSVAAILKAFESVDYILPVATFAGTEYGDYNVLYENFMKLKEDVEDKYGDQKVLYALHEYSRPDLWHLMNGKVGTLIMEKYGFYVPCIGCHLYFHLTKIPFAQALSGRIISGERASHDGRIKVNQLNISLEAYKSVLATLGFDLWMPLQHVYDGDAIQDLIGWTWEEGKDHPKCVLSGNYRDTEGKAIFDAEKLHAFLEGYLKPVGQLMGRHMKGELTERDLRDAIKELL